MPNPSTLASHFEDELVEQRAIAFDLRRPKADREVALRKVREIEDTLGIEHEPYNGGVKGQPIRCHVDLRPKQTATALFHPVDGKTYLLTAGQRMILIDALKLVLGDDQLARDEELDHERELLVELFLRK